MVSSDDTYSIKKPLTSSDLTVKNRLTFFMTRVILLGHRPTLIDSDANVTKMLLASSNWIRLHEFSFRRTLVSYKAFETFWLDLFDLSVIVGDINSFIRPSINSDSIIFNWLSFLMTLILIQYHQPDLIRSNWIILVRSYDSYSTKKLSISCEFTVMNRLTIFMTRILFLDRRPTLIDTEASVTKMLSARSNWIWLQELLLRSALVSSKSFWHMLIGSDWILN